MKANHIFNAFVVATLAVLCGMPASFAGEGFLSGLSLPFSGPKQQEIDPFRRSNAQTRGLPTDINERARYYLRKGREQLDRDNIPAATHYQKMAAELAVQFAPNEFSPARLLADINHRGARMGAPATFPQSQTPFRRLPATGPLQQRTNLSGMQSQYPLTRNPGANDNWLRSNLGDSQVRHAGGFIEPGIGGQRAVFHPQRDNTFNRLAGGSTGQIGAPKSALGSGQSDPARRAFNAPVVQRIDGGRPGGPRQMPPATNSIATFPRPAIGAPAKRPSGYMNPAGRPRTMHAGNTRPGMSRLAQGGPGNSVLSPPATPVPNQAQRLVEQGDRASDQGNDERAARFYQQALEHGRALDPNTRQRLKDWLMFVHRPAPRRRASSLMEEAEFEQRRLYQQVRTDVQRHYRRARDVKESDPLAAARTMHQARELVKNSSLPDSAKTKMMVLVNNYIVEMDKNVEQRRPALELDARNRAALADVDQRRRYKVEVGQRLAKLVDEFNKLVNEKRYHEAEVRAKQAKELAPDEAVTTLMVTEIKILARVDANNRLRDLKERAVWGTLHDVETSAIPFPDNNPFVFPTEWQDLSKRRSRYGGEGRRRWRPKEIEIRKKLRATPVSLSFQDAPLAEVLEHLKSVSGINIYLDPQGLAEEAVDASTPVSIRVDDISLDSALRLILDPLNLSHVIKHEVLKITSAQLRAGEVYTETFYVADMVIPIPNFTPHNGFGLDAALQKGYMRTHAGIQGGVTPVAARFAANGAGGPGQIPGNVLAQTATNLPPGMAGAGAGGTASPNFDNLIDLIVRTIEPNSWAEVGGPGSIVANEHNLSLVIRTTQDIHEKIRDLLEQLRRLQDLQVTIEVRFITLNENFFERIGIDFDFNIDDNVDILPADDSGNSVTVGRNAQNNPEFPNLTDDFDFWFRQNSFGATAPVFGAFDPLSAATFGIAIISDIEAFFLIEAAQGDQRQNVLQAPKVTLFNGQTASIADSTQTPFVTSVTPVVGDFSAAQAPVISVLNEGTTLTVQAVVSADRRFVRLTLVPFFSQVKGVKTFTFTGTTTTTQSESQDVSDDGDPTNSTSSNNNFQEGTSVQLPAFAFTTVTTTVSVPDGGTVLLGGIKRLREGRQETGVPFLSKIPYVNRLFKNVGIGRDLDSLMLMVTPRIIIQEEEEAKLGVKLD